MIMLASALLCSKFSKRCYMTMGPFRPRRNTTITHHHRNPCSVSQPVGHGLQWRACCCYASSLAANSTKLAGSQPASTAITSHAKALGFQSLKLRHIWLWGAPGWFIMETVLNPQKLPAFGSFFCFQSTKIKTKTNKLLEISTNLRYKKTISHILRLFLEFATLLIVRIGLHHREWQTLSAFPANCSS